MWKKQTKLRYLALTFSSSSMTWFTAFSTWRATWIDQSCDDALQVADEVVQLFTNNKTKHNKYTNWNICITNVLQILRNNKAITTPQARPGSCSCRSRGRWSSESHAPPPSCSPPLPRCWWGAWSLSFQYLWKSESERTPSSPHRNCQDIANYFIDIDNFLDWRHLV